MVLIKLGQKSTYIQTYLGTERDRERQKGEKEKGKEEKRGAFSLQGDSLIKRSLEWCCKY